MPTISFAKSNREITNESFVIILQRTMKDQWKKITEKIPNTGTELNKIDIKNFKKSIKVSGCIIDIKSVCCIVTDLSERYLQLKLWI